MDYLKKQSVPNYTFMHLPHNHVTTLSIPSTYNQARIFFMWPRILMFLFVRIVNMMMRVRDSEANVTQIPFTDILLLLGHLPLLTRRSLPFVYHLHSIKSRPKKPVFCVVKYTVGGERIKKSAKKKTFAWNMKNI